MTTYPDLPALPPRFGRHYGGLCGGPAQACEACIAADATALTAWAATAPPPAPGDTPGLYWRRLSDAVAARHGRATGLWIDAWYGVAFDRVRAMMEV